MATHTVKTGAGVTPSGLQVELQHGDQRAVVVEVGGGLRDYRVAGRPLLDGYGPDEHCTGARGQTLIPWPNRISDGRYEFARQTLQLPLTEPQVGNAIHGLTRWATWTVLEQSRPRVVMGHRLYPQPGYPFLLDCRIEYQLDDSGLAVRTTATNIGQRSCPYGTGAHPYLTVGGDTVGDAVLTAPGQRYLPTDDRGIPTGTADVEDTHYDFRSGRSLRGIQLDYTFTGLDRDADGVAWVELRSADGRTASQLWLDESYPYLELFTGDTLPEVERRRRGLGVEPMTCAPDAFRSGAGLLVLQPGQTTSARWGLRAGR